MPLPVKDQVFISYSHEDTKWREDLEKHLKPYLRAGSIKSWSDKQISPGSQWLTEIKTALTNTKVAVLLVTPDFIASDFIHENELGPFLKEAKQGGVRILWVPVRASSYKKTVLKNYQAVLDPAQPLAHMTGAQRDQAWVKICEELESALALSRAPAAHLSSNKPDEAAAPVEHINGDAIAARNPKDSVEATVAKKSDVELDHATSTTVGTVLKPEDHIQRAQVSWREARRDYESLGVNAENQRTRIDALYRWKDSAQDYFSKQADAFLIKQPGTENSWNESYAERVLNELADHHATIGQAARQLGIDPKTLVPPFIKFIELQACLREKEPQIASALRNRFIEVGLPTYGFDENTSQDLEWRWFILGCVLLLFAIALVLWGFSLAKLTWDQQRLLVWALPLASGFSAAAFAGSIYTQARNWIPGIAITATGGFAVWLITFFFLFPENKIDNYPKPSPTIAPSVAITTPPVVPTPSPSPSITPFANEVKIGDKVFLRSWDGTYVIAASGVTSNWPRLGKIGKVPLKLLGKTEQVRNGSTVEIQSLEEHLTNGENILGVDDSRQCYYQKLASDDARQEWKIVKFDGTEPVLHYAEQFYLENVYFKNKRLGKDPQYQDASHTTEDQSGGEYLTIEEGVNWWWILEKNQF